MSTTPEQIMHLSMHCEKPLRVAIGLESTHLSLLLACMFMGYLGSLVLPLLHHDIENIAVLVDRCP